MIRAKNLKDTIDYSRHLCKQWQDRPIEVSGPTELHQIAIQCASLIEAFEIVQQNARDAASIWLTEDDPES